MPRPSLASCFGTRRRTPLSDVAPFGTQIVKPNSARPTGRRARPGWSQENRVAAAAARREHRDGRRADGRQRLQHAAADQRHLRRGKPPPRPVGSFTIVSVWAPELPIVTVRQLIRTTSGRSRRARVVRNTGPIVAAPPRMNSQCTTTSGSRPKATQPRCKQVCRGPCRARAGSARGLSDAGSRSSIWRRRNRS